MSFETPNCMQCPYRKDDACVIYGAPVDSTLVCALFRKWHHREGDDVPRAYPLLQQLEPGVVYRIDNDLDSEPNPRPAWRVVPVDQTTE